MSPRSVCVLLFVAQVSPVVAQGGSELDRGRWLYEIHCVSCHGLRGEGGKGTTLAQATLPRASDPESMLKIIRGGISGTEMPSSPLQPDALSAVVVYVTSLGSQPREQVPGNANNGAKLYATKGACAQCHTLRGQGVAIGPDLTLVGRRRSAEYLRRALVDPAADVPQSPNLSEFLLVRVNTRDGRAVAGVRVNEDTFSIQLRDAGGRAHSFLKAELSELHKDWGKSTMPGYTDVFTPAELDDVVAFLVSLRNAPRALDAEKAVRPGTATHSSIP